MRSPSLLSQLFVFVFVAFIIPFAVFQLTEMLNLKLQSWITSIHFSVDECIFHIFQLLISQLLYSKKLETNFQLTTDDGRQYCFSVYNFLWCPD
jgi:hypothetical protein